MKCMSASKTSVTPPENDPKNGVSTTLFKVPSGLVLQIMYRRFGKWPSIVTGALVVAVCVLGVCIDPAWFVVALMLLFIALPMVAAYLYFWFGMRPECFVNTHLHRLTIQRGAVDVALITEADPETGTAERTTLYTFAIDRRLPYTAGANGLTIIPAPPSKGFFYVPYDAFRTTADLDAATELLYPKTDKPNP